MAVLYRVSFKTESDKQLGDWFPPQGLGAAMERVRNRMKKWEPEYKQRERGEDWGQLRPFDEAAAKFKKALAGNNEGDIRMMTGEFTDAVVAVRKVQVVDVDYPSMPSQATAKVKALIHPLWDEFPSLASWGVYNCRHIAGSSSWSEHSWGDALDVHPPTMVYGDKVNRWLLSNRGRFGLTRVLWRVAGHLDHLHIDFDPDHSGTPPCA